MPRIYNPEQASFVEARQVDGGVSQTINRAIGMINEAQNDRFVIDATNFEMEKIAAFEQMEQNSRYDTATGKTYIGDSEIEGSLPEYAMRVFDERAAGIKKKYGQRGEEWAAKKKVESFSMATNLNSRIVNLGNVDYFGTVAQQFSRGVETGVTDFNEARTSAHSMLSDYPMTPEARQQTMNMLDDLLTTGQFSRDLKESPEVAIQRVNKSDYTSASLKAQESFARETDSFIKGQAMEEGNAALQRAQYGFRHNPDPNVVRWLELRGMKQEAAALKGAQDAAKYAYDLVNDTVPNAQAKVSALEVRARTSGDPKAMALHQQAMAVLANHTKIVVDNPELALAQAGIETPDIDISNPMSFVEGRRDISGKTVEKFGVQPSFLGEHGRVLSDIVKQAPANQRSSIIARYSMPMNEIEKQRATVEMRDVNPRLAVAMTLPMQQAELGNQVLSDIDSSYIPKDKLFIPVVSGLDEDMEWGDVHAKEAVIESAKNVYAYRAKMKNMSAESVDTDMFKEIVKELSGSPISFGRGKAPAFRKDNGDWADSDKASRSLKYAIEVGEMPDVYDGKGKPLNINNMAKYARLVPSGRNGQYYAVRYTDTGKEYYQNDDGTPYTIDMKSLLNKYGGKR